LSFLRFPDQVDWPDSVRGAGVQRRLTKRNAMGGPISIKGLFVTQHWVMIAADDPASIQFEIAESDMKAEPRVVDRS